MNIWKWIKGAFSWLWRLLNIFNDKIIIPALKQIGEDGKDFLIQQIRLQAQNNDIEGLQKLKNVANAFKKEYSYKNVANNLLTGIIALLYSNLKKDKEV